MDTKQELLDQVAAQQHKIAALEASLAEARSGMQNYGRALEELESLRTKYADDLFQERQTGQQWHEEALNWQHAYEQLRVQKGGFGLKAMSVVGTASFLFGILLCFAVLRLTDQRQAQLNDFRRDYQFRIEYDLSHRDFNSALDLLDNSMNDRRYRQVRPQIEMMRATVQAASTGCDKN